MHISNTIQLLLAVAAVSVLYLMAKHPQVLRLIPGIAAAGVLAFGVYMMHAIANSGGQFLAHFH